jgi:transposase
VITVSGRQAGRVTVAALACYRPGRTSRLLYRIHVHHRRAAENASFTETDYIRLLDAAHHQLGGPIVLIWDNLNRHISAKMCRHLQARPWPTVVRLPAYAPELNPVEGAWSILKRSLGNLAVHHIDQLAKLITHRLKPMQYRPTLIDGFLAQTGLTLDL